MRPITLVSCVLLPLAALSAGCLPDSFIITPISASKEMEEKVLYSESLLPDGKIAIIAVDGVMLNGKQPGLLTPGDNPVIELLEQLDDARRDPGVKGVVLRINSPGGSVTAAELMHTELVRFKKSGKPVVAVMLDVAASGGYYIACGADEIIAHHSTITGSIGVVMQLFEVTGTMQKIGVTPQTIKSGAQKAAGSPFERLTPEQREVFQNVIDELYDQFVGVVDAGRKNLTREQVVTLADGRIYTSSQALEAGLIDRIGTVNDAIESVKKRAGVKKAKVIRYERPYTETPNYYARTQPADPRTQVNLINFDIAGLNRAASPPFMYLWLPN